MIDPITILATFCAIISASHALYQWYHHHRDKKLGKPSDLESRLLGGFMQLWKKYNRTASLMGRKFQLHMSSNETLYTELTSLGPQLRKVQIGLRVLKEPGDAVEQNSLLDGTMENHKSFNDLARLVKNLQSRADSALTKFSKQHMLAETKVQEMEDENLQVKKPLRPFCDGAILFQSGGKTEQELDRLAGEISSATDWGYICHSCGLEVAHYPAVRFSRNDKALGSSILLTASHLKAFKWADRRAFYRCLCCFQNRKICDFATAVAFERHMEQHPDFTMMREEDETRQVCAMEHKEEEIFQGLEPADFGSDMSDIDETEDAISASDKSQYEERHQYDSSLQNKNVEPDTAVSVEGRNLKRTPRTSRRASANVSPVHSHRSNTFKMPKATQAALINQPSVSQHVPGEFPSGTPYSTSPARFESDSTSVYELDDRSREGQFTKTVEETMPLSNNAINTGPVATSYLGSSGFLGEGLSSRPVNQPSTTSAEVMSPDLGGVLQRKLVSPVNKKLIASSGPVSESIVNTPKRPAPGLPATQSNSATARQPDEKWVYQDGKCRYMKGTHIVKEQQNLPGDEWVYSAGGWSDQGGKKWVIWRTGSKKYEYSDEPYL